MKRAHLLVAAAILSLGISASANAQPSATNSGGLTATILGSGSPQYDPDRAGPSVLIQFGDTDIIIDTGNGAQAQLDKAALPIRKLDGILFTHHHLDHNEEFIPIFIHTLLGDNLFVLAGPAPVDAILGAYTIAPFDYCGGHVNLHVGYHYHAVTNCLTDIGKGSAPDPHAAPIGIALDGYKILSHLTSDGKAPADLDSCQGHKTDGEGYHYHAGAPGSNKIIGCLTAQYGCSSSDAKQSCDAGIQRGPPG